MLNHLRQKKNTIFECLTPIEADATHQHLTIYGKIFISMLNHHGQKLDFKIWNMGQKLDPRELDNTGNMNFREAIIEKEWDSRGWENMINKLFLKKI